MAAGCNVGGKIRMIQLDSAVYYSDYHIGIAHSVIIPYRLAVDIVIGVTEIVLSPHLVPVWIIDGDILPVDAIWLHTQDTRHSLKNGFGGRQGHILVVFYKIPAVKAFGTRTWLEFSGIREKALERRNAHAGHQISKLGGFCAQSTYGSTCFKAGGKVLAEIYYGDAWHDAGVIQQRVCSLRRIHSGLLSRNGCALRHFPCTGKGQRCQERDGPDIQLHLSAIYRSGQRIS